MREAARRASSTMPRRRLRDADERGAARRACASASSACARSRGAAASRVEGRRAVRPARTCASTLRRGVVASRVGTSRTRPSSTRSASAVTAHRLIQHRQAGARPHVLRVEPDLLASRYGSASAIALEPRQRVADHEVQIARLRTSAARTPVAPRAAAATPRRNAGCCTRASRARTPASAGRARPSPRARLAGALAVSLARDVDQRQRLMRLRRRRLDRQLGVRPRFVAGGSGRAACSPRRARRSVRLAAAGSRARRPRMPPRCRPAPDERRRVLRPHVGHVRIVIQDPPQQRRAFVEPAVAERFDRAAVRRAAAAPCPSDRRASRSTVPADDDCGADVAERRQALPILVGHRRRCVDVAACDQRIERRSAALPPPAPARRRGWRVPSGSRSRSYSSSRGALM